MTDETFPLFAGFGNKSGRAIGGHHSAKAGSEDWLTPPHVIEALGGWQSFALDPCQTLSPPWPTARNYYTVKDNGLMMPWDGRVWLNPPYSTTALNQWLGRLSEHGQGTALIFARTETAPFSRWVWGQASAVLFIKGRLTFHRPDGSLCTVIDKHTGKTRPANGGAPSVLVAYGQNDADVLAYCSIDGQFVPLRIPRSVLAVAINPTWRSMLEEWFSDHDEPVDLSDLYRTFADHPKARANQHYREKLRQELQRGPFERIGRGRWKKKGHPEERP